MSRTVTRNRASRGLAAPGASEKRCSFKLLSSPVGNRFGDGSLRSVLRKVLLPILSFGVSNIKPAGVRHREWGMAWGWLIFCEKPPQLAQ